MRKILISLTIVLTFFIGCDLLDSTKTTLRRFSYTSADSIEAYEVALWFSGKLEPPDSTIRTHLYNLKFIRTIFQDSIPVSAIRFLPPWIVGEIAVKFDDTTAAKVRNSTYTGWNSLSPEFQPTDSSTIPDDLGWSLLKFRKPFHPRRLAEMYRLLPGVIYAEPNHYICIGGTCSTVYPAIVDSIYSYYFVQGLLSGSHGEYFKMIDNTPHYIGRWFAGSGDTMPSWYNEVGDIVYNFGTWDGYE